MEHSPDLIIFDMDDTLVATAGLWKRAESRLLEYCGAAWTAEFALQYKGMNALDVAAVIHRQTKPPIECSELQAMMRRFLTESFHDGPIVAMPGAVDCVRALAATRKLVVASGSPATLIDFALSVLGIRDCFAALVTSEDVPRGKPHPDVFLHAAHLLGAAPADCLVIEDSLIGVQAARAAGMRCYAIPSSRPDDIRKLADYTEADFAGLSELVGVSR